METKISGLKIRRFTSQRLDRDAEAAFIPTGLIPGTTVRGEIWLHLRRKSEIEKLKRFVATAGKRYRFVNTRYLRSQVPCTICAYFWEDRIAYKSCNTFAVGVIAPLIETYTPGCVHLRWFEERAININDPAEVAAAFEKIRPRVGK